MPSESIVALHKCVFAAALLDVLQNTVQLIQRIVVNLQDPLTLCGVSDIDRGTKLVGELGFKSQCIRILFRLATLAAFLL